MNTKYPLLLLTVLALVGVCLIATPSDASLPESNVVHGSDYEITYGASSESPTTQTFIVGWQYYDILIGYGEDAQGILPGMTVSSVDGKIYMSGTPAEAKEALITFTAGTSIASLFVEAVESEGYGTDPTWEGSSTVYITDDDVYLLDIGFYAQGDIPVDAVPAGMELQMTDVGGGVYKAILNGTPEQFGRYTFTSSVTNTEFLVIVQTLSEYGVKATGVNTYYDDGDVVRLASSPQMWIGMYAWAGYDGFGPDNTASNKLIGSVTSSNTSVITVEIDPEMPNFNDNTGTYVNFYFHKVGSSTITVRSADGGATKSFTLVVEDFSYFYFKPGAGATGSQVQKTFYNGTGGQLYSQAQLVQWWSKPGYTLTGLNTKEDGTGTSYSFGQTITSFPNSVTVYGIWSPANFTITFDSQGGTAVSNAVVTYGQKYSQGTGWPTANPTKANYVFQGWYTPENVKVTGNDTVTLTQNTTLHAVWALVKHTVKYYGLTSSVIGTEQVEHGGHISQYVNGISIVGYQFRGWKTSTGTVVNGSTAINSDMSLFGQYEPSKYTVTLVTNNGTSNINVTVTYGQSYSDGTNWPASISKTGYKFAGWFKESSFTNQVFPTDRVYITANTTFYAKWTTAAQCTVNYHKLGDSQSIGSETVLEDNPISRYANGVPLTGYTFKKWLYANGTQYNGENITANTDLYGVYEGLQFTISFFTDGGNQLSDATVTYGDRYSDGYMWPADPQKPGYYFVGWYKESALTNVVLPNDKVNILEDKTFYAKWADAPVVTVTYYKQGENTPIGSEQIAQGLGITQYRSGVPLRGCDFVRWLDADGKFFNPDTRIYSSISLYGVYESARITIHFDTHGGSMVDDATVRFGSKYNQGAGWPSADPTRDGFYFDGWYLDEERTSTPIIGTDYVSLTESPVTLHAKWTVESRHLVTYYMKGGSSSIASERVAHGGYISMYSAGVTLEGYTFDHWETSNGQRYSTSTPVNMDIELFGVYAGAPVTIHFDTHGGNSIANANATYGARYNQAQGWPTANPTKANYKFDGWFTDDEFTMMVNPTDTVLAMTEITLHAKWLPAPITPDDDPVDTGVIAIESQKTDAGALVTLRVVTTLQHDSVEWIINGHQRTETSDVISVSLSPGKYTVEAKLLSSTGLKEVPSKTFKVSEDSTVTPEDGSDDSKDMMPFYLVIGAVAAVILAVFVAPRLKL